MGVPPIEQTRANLLKAWAEWDEAPAHREHVIALDQAYDAHGAHLGLRGAQLRDLAIAWRRCGYRRPQALTAIEAGIAVTRG